MKKTLNTRLSKLQGALAVSLVSLLSLLFLPAQAATSAEATTPTFRLSIKHDGIRASTGEETLRHSPLWDGGSNETATVTLAENGVSLAENLTAEGEQAWRVSRNGTYNLTHTTYTNGAVAKVLNATFVVTGKDVPFPPGSVTASGYNGKFDGNGHGITVTTTDIESPSITYSRTEAGPYTETNPLFTNVCDETVWYVVAAPGYIIETNSETVVVTQGDIGGGGGDEPGPGEIPEGGLSKFDATYMYDGDGHAINTQALFAVTLPGAVPSFSFVPDVGGLSGGQPLPAEDAAWVAEAPVYTNVGEYVVWYRITAANYSNYIHAAKVSVTNRPITLATVAAIADQMYTGAEIRPVPSVSDERILVGMTDPTNILTAADYAVSYADNVDTGTAKLILTGAHNYAGVVTNTFLITPSPIPFGPTVGITATGYTNVYDGAGHGASVAAVGLKTTPTIQYKDSPEAEWQDDSPTYRDVCDTQVWWKVSAPNYSDATGTIGVKISLRPVSLSSGTKTDFIYDGQPHDNPHIAISGFGFAVGEGITTSNWATVTTVAQGEVANTFDYAPLAGTKLANYDITVVTGKIAVVKGSLPPSEDPEKPDPKKPLPPGGVSKFDGVAMYDGAGHTLETNKLVQAFEAVVVGDGTRTWYAREQNGNGAVAPTSGWSEMVPVFTNACEEIVWYKVTNPNYEDYIHAARVTVTNRPITVTSASGSWVYDTTAHATNGISVAGLSVASVPSVAAVPSAADPVVVGLVGDDTLIVSGFPAITDVGSKANDFAWAFGAGTLATNYCVSCVTGVLEVTARMIGDDPANWDIRLDKDPNYCGTELSAPIIRVAFRKPDGNLEDISYTLAGDKATDAGNYTLKITGTGNYSGTVDKEWAIMPRNVTFTSATTNWVYDGVSHVADNVAIGGDGFVGEEGVEFAGFPQIRHVADAPTPVANDFTYVWKDNTKAGNYVIKTFKGTVQMSPLAVTVTSKNISKPYDGSPLKLTAAEIEVTLTGGAAGGDVLGAPLPTGESFVYGDFAERTESGQTSATFSIAAGANTKLTNYTITPVYGTITITKKEIVPGGPDDPEKPDPTDPLPPGSLSRFDGRWVYNGLGQTIDTNKLFAVCDAKLVGEYAVVYGVDGTTWSENPPTIKDVGTMTMWYKIVSPNYEDYAHEAKVTVGPKTVTVEMLAYSDDAFFYDGSKTKVPDVILVDTNAFGTVISTLDDWTRAYGERQVSGEWPVTLTGQNNYTGSATALFKNIKRPVAPPLIPSMAYNGKNRKPTITIAKDKETGADLYCIVANPGGINAGEYTNVVLQLVETADYKWKGYAEDGPDTWTGVFTITKAANGWSTYPGMKSWTNGVDKASEPTGKARYGTLSVAYRTRGAAVTTETAAKPSKPGQYTARFWVEATQNYAGVALEKPYDVDFEIFRGPNDPPEEEKTKTTPVPVPHSWLDPYVAVFGGDYEAAGNATGLNGKPLWASYVAGLDPTDPTSQFEAVITLGPDGTPQVSWDPDLSEATPPRTYTTYGKAKLTDKDWTPVNDQNKPQMRFFKVGVELEQ